MNTFIESVVSHDKSEYTEEKTSLSLRLLLLVFILFARYRK